MKFTSSDSAVSEVMGHAIILAITIVGVSMIVLAGVPSILKLEDLAKIRNAEQTSTVLDSLASSTILGDSPQQVINMNLEGGISSIEPNSTNSPSYISIQSENKTFNLVLPLGKITYRLDERIIAYEGGGLWSKYPTGSVMISPPEFHYDGRTLTLPVINLIGNGSIGGKGTAAIFLKKNLSMVLFPNTSISPNMTNPLDYNLTGKVYVNITSDYYDAWADYARNLIFTQVSTDSAKHMASIELRVVPTSLGGWSDYTNVINLRGLPEGDDPLNNFSFNIKDSFPYFTNFNWQLTALSGTKTLIFDLKKGTDLSIGYRDTTHSPNAEIWDGSNVFTTVGNTVLVDLLDKSKQLTYTGVNVGTNNPCANKMKPSDLSVSAFSWGSRTINTTAGSNTESIYNITQHYIALMSGGNFYFTGCSPASSHGPETGSQMLIGYDPKGAITFLHIQNNIADVSIR